jgi:hypothetical protein
MKKEAILRKRHADRGSSQNEEPSTNVSPNDVKLVSTTDQLIPSGLAYSFTVAVLSGLAANSSFSLLTQVDPGCSHCVTFLQQGFSLVATWDTARRFAFGDPLCIPWGFHIAGQVPSQICRFFFPFVPFEMPTCMFVVCFGTRFHLCNRRMHVGKQGT